MVTWIKTPALACRLCTAANSACDEVHLKLSSIDEIEVFWMLALLAITTMETLGDTLSIANANRKDLPRPHPSMGLQVK